MVERAERDGRVEPVPELRREQPLDLGAFVARLLLRGEAHHRPVERLGSGVGRHDDDDVPEVGLPAVVVGEGAVVHHLQQDVEDVRMRLLDLVEQQHRVRLLGDRLGQESALVEADVAGGRADQARHRVPLHVFGHVEAVQLDPHAVGELARDLGLADAGGPAEEEAADRLLRIGEPGARGADRRHQRLDRLIRRPSSAWTWAGSSARRPPRRSRRSPCRAGAGR